MLRALGFFRCGLAAKRSFKHVFDTVRGVCQTGIAFELLGPMLRELDDEWGVQERQGLAGNIRDLALADRAGWRRRIKRGQKRVEVVALHSKVNTASGRFPSDRRSVHIVQLQITRDAEKRITDGFSFKPAHVEMREQNVVRIFCECVSRGDARQLPCFRCDEILDQFLDRVTMICKPDGEVIQQFRMRRLLAHAPEIVRSRYNSTTKEMMPDAVHDHARR